MLTKSESGFTRIIVIVILIAIIVLAIWWERSSGEPSQTENTPQGSVESSDIQSDVDSLNIDSELDVDFGDIDKEINSL